MKRALFLTFFLAISSFAAPLERCGEEEKKSDIYQSFQACENARLAATINKGVKPPACPNTIQDAKDPKGVLKKLCQDPSGFVCSLNQAKFLDSHCELSLFSTNDIMNSPDFVSTNCSFQAKKQKLIQSHLKECQTATQLSLPDCIANIKVIYQDQIQQMERDAFYTDERTVKMQNIFEGVVTIYAQKIVNSKTIPTGLKPMLLAKIRNTMLLVPLPKENPPQCANSGPDGPDSGIYNDSQGHIVFCLGAMSTLDHMNVLDLTHTLAHELSHSIDPCALEYDAFQRDPMHDRHEIGFKIYPELITCLRGGKGEQACDGAILHCNNAKGTQEALDEEIKLETTGNTLSPEALTALKGKLGQMFKVTPDCPHGKRDPSDHERDLSDFRKDTEPVEQIRDSFADFMASEVVGETLKQNFDAGKALTPLALFG